MASIMRVTTRWSGFTGAPGFTNMFFRDFGTDGSDGTEGTNAQAAAAAARVRTFWDTIKAGFPEEVKLDVQGEVDVLEDSTGELVNTLAAGAIATVTGTSPATFAGPVGMVINWRTSAIRNGRRIRGRTFLVPMASVQFQASGGVSAAAATSIQAAAIALADRTSSPDLGVWARPSAPLAADGQWAVVETATVPQMAAVLRSRRD